MSRSIGLLLLTPSLLLWAGLAACEGAREVAVRVTVPGLDSVETPVPGLELIALPYDRDSILAALEARAAAPRPNTAPLDSLFRRFRGPFTQFSAAAYRADRLRDSLAALERRLAALPRGGPERDALAGRAAAVSDSLRAAEARREHARAALDSARTDFVTRSDSLRAAIRHWEDSTYRGYDSIVRNLALVRARDPVADTTGPAGWAYFTLRPGRWWIYARSWDASDPNAEWYWNVPVQGDTLRLSSRTGRRQPRY